ncbi:MAG: hypothetical protein ACD_75C00302G0008 [uncultured bacterium]|nr:MAG: hypothetical protein ACD_75C00302G0008 [uncultured bacterium]
MTLPTSTGKDTRETWNIALQWVSANQKFIRKVAAPYMRHMAAEKTDLLQEATIAAFKAVIATRKKDKPDQFISFFRVIFKTNCIKLATGIHTVHCLEDFYLPCSDPVEESHEIDETTSTRINEALQSVSKRQREVCLWLLQQSVPASTPDIAKKFQVSRRHACRLVSGSIQRISHTLR